MDPSWLKFWPGQPSLLMGRIPLDFENRFGIDGFKVILGVSLHLVRKKIVELVLMETFNMIPQVTRL